MCKFIVANKWLIIASISIILFVTALFKGLADSSPQVQIKPTDPKPELSTWVVDWQWKSGMDDLRSISSGLTRVQMFAAYFDEADHLYFTDTMNEALPALLDTMKETGLTDVDLTLVNDRLNQDGTEVQKDSELITRLMATDQSRSKHIDEIVDTLKKYDYRGVEIDYEKIKDSDWDNVIAFYTELYQRLDAMDKSLRIVLESRTPIEKIRLPEGPAYVMMAYNLFGTHSGPGPKADIAFITELAERMDRLPGDNIIAISAGGFDWNEKDKVTALTEKRATELSQKSVNPPKRDTASGSIYFDYMDDDLVKHTVWYADGLTLTQWMNTLRQLGYPKIAIWRLGELGEDTLQQLNRWGQ